MKPNLRSTSLMPFFAFISLVASFVVLGCGGGGGGGSSTNGGTTSGSGTRIRGNVRNNDSLVGIPFVTVNFYTTTGTLVGQAVTTSTGSFEAQVTTIPTLMHLANSSWPLGYYRTYNYSNKWYLPAQATCKAGLPTIAPNVVTNLSVIELQPGSAPPPPPPNGCPVGP